MQDTQAQLTCGRCAHWRRHGAAQHSRAGIRRGAGRRHAPPNGELGKGGPIAAQRHLQSPTVTPAQPDRLPAFRLATHHVRRAGRVVVPRIFRQVLRCIRFVGSDRWQRLGSLALGTDVLRHGYERTASRGSQHFAIADVYFCERMRLLALASSSSSVAYGNGRAVRGWGDVVDGGDEDSEGVAEERPATGKGLRDGGELGAERVQGRGTVL